MSAVPRERRQQRCPDCGNRVTNMERHLRDTGAAETLPEGSCPQLFIRRNNLDRGLVCAECCEEHTVCECDLGPTDSQIEAYMARAS